MTTTPQAALLTDDEVAQCINLARTNLFDRAGTTSFRIARSIEQAILAKLQATQEPVHAGELPAFEQWWRQRQLLTFPKDYDQSRLAEWGDAYKPAAKAAWQARAALSARKPLTEEQRSKVFRDAETRMVYDLNLSWRNAVVDEVERAHGINGLEVKP